ncbi:hypothetical protein OROMI_023957 [Orobanche minor]
MAIAMDNGNNNKLLTIVKANYPPNGIDYPRAIPTGRFSNGRNLADFLAQHLGFSSPIPPFATSSNGSDILRGVNCASGGGGILDLTGIQLGGVLSFNQQLRNHRTTISRISGILGNQKAVDNHLHQCLYVINFGNEDYQLSQQLRTLNSVGSRKVVVYRLTMLGCIPEELIRYPTLKSPCVDSINDGVELYNQKVFTLLNNLNADLGDARFIFVNLTDLSSANPSATGTRVTREACCKVGILTGLCAPKGKVCSNRDEYYYWDNYHPTEFVYNIFATRAYNATIMHH